MRKKNWFQFSILGIALFVALTLATGTAGAQEKLSSGQNSSAEDALPAYIRGLNFFLQLLEDEPDTLEMATYLVEAGDSVYEIAREFDIDPGAIVVANDIENPHLISPGQELLIPPPGEIYHLVAKEDTLEELGDFYEVDWKQIVAANELQPEQELEEGSLLQIPGGTVPASLWQSSIPVISRSSASQVSFLWPITGRITSYYGPRWGRFHRGIDIARPTGTPIQAAASGTVTVSRWYSSYGYAVFIDHGNGWQTRYGHISKLLVDEGEWVNRGDTIALVGETGNATGPHLHLEILYNGDPRNPLNYLP